MTVPPQSDKLFHVNNVTAKCRIVVMGVGGAGCNSLTRMSSRWKEGPPLIAVNTDTQSLASCSASHCIQIGKQTTRGFGAGGDWTAGRLAAEESIHAIDEWLSRTDLLFLVVGLGGGTGTGAAPVIAEAARKMGVLTLVFATLPFPFEGDRVRRQADEGLRNLQKAADATIALPNQRLLEIVGPDVPLDQSFSVSDDMLAAGIHGLWQLLDRNGVINVDFADVRNLAEHSGGSCAFAHSEASGSNRIAEAVRQLMDSPMLERGRLLGEAQGLLVNITGGPDLTLADVQGIMNQFQSTIRPAAHFFMGAAMDAGYREKIAITVLVSEHWMENGSRITTAALHDDLKGDVAPKNTGKVIQHELELAVTPSTNFGGIEPTLHMGQDLDTPTYVRRGLKLMAE